MEDYSEAAAPDGAGGLFIGGGTLGSLGGPNQGSYDIWLARFDSSGSQLWFLQVGSAGNEGVASIVPDGQGGTYICGLTGGNLGGPSSGFEDGYVARYDGAGNPLWIRQLGSNTWDRAFAAAPDGAGGVIIGGDTLGSLGGTAAGSWDPWFARYDSAGNQLWIRQLGTSVGDNLQAAVSDGSGGVYVCGFTQGSLGGPSSGQYDAWFARYDSAGNQLWIRQTGTTDLDFASGAAPDGSGGLYIGGDTRGSMGAPNKGAEDAWIARYDAAGNQLWIRQFGSSGRDILQDAELGASGDVYVTGYAFGNVFGSWAGNNDVWVAHYDSSGNKAYGVQFGANGHDNGTCLAEDGAGGVFAGGRTASSLGAPNAGDDDLWLAHYDNSCEGGSSYCTASTTSIPGCQAAISASGWPNIASPSAFTITSGAVPGGNLGICFLGDNGPASIPFGTLGGKVCVQPPVFRSSAKPSGGTTGMCTGNFSFTLQDLINASPIVVAGATINAEIWARDPPNPDGFLLSNGLSFNVCP